MAAKTATCSSGDLCASANPRHTGNDLLSRLKNFWIATGAAAFNRYRQVANQSFYRKQLGAQGESLASRFLMRKGFRILERNYACSAGEVDIIAEDAGTIVFVEVKTRSPRALATPESAVTPEKQAHILRVARYYLRSYRQQVPVRFDVVAVLTDDRGKMQSLRLLKDAFRPGDVHRQAPEASPAD